MRRHINIVLGAASMTIGLAATAVGLVALLGSSDIPQDSSDRIKATLVYVRDHARPFPATVLATPPYNTLQENYELRVVPLPQEVQGNPDRSQLFSDEITTGYDREYGCQTMVKPGLDEHGAPSDAYLTVVFSKTSCKDVLSK